MFRPGSVIWQIGISNPGFLINESQIPDFQDKPESQVIKINPEIQSYIPENSAKSRESKKHPGFPDTTEMNKFQILKKHPASKSKSRKSSGSRGFWDLLPTPRLDLFCQTYFQSLPKNRLRKLDTEKSRSKVQISWLRVRYFLLIFCQSNNRPNWPFFQTKNCY